MSLPKFSEIIRRIFVGNPIAGVEEALAKLNPDKIYVENVRSLLHTSTEQALRICETAVRQHLFTRRVEVLCPDGQAAASASCEKDLPETIVCWQEIDGNYEETTLRTATLQKLTFYRLNDQAADEYEKSGSELHGTTA
jgi:predicted polyphosphate/ATP-dependent NAD kinase